MSALTLDSGSFPLIPRTKASNDDHRSDDTPSPSHWLSAAAIGLTGCGLVGATAILVLLYLLAATAGHVGPARALLLGATVSTASVAGMALIAGWAVHVQDVREAQHLAAQRAELEQTAAAMACTAAKLRVALDELPEDIRDRVAAQGRAVLVVTDGISQQLARVETAVQDLGERLDAVQAAAVDMDWLRGLTAWAARIDQRLAEVQAVTGSSMATVPASSNGHREESPMELTDEALKGYFLGFYDRERGGGGKPE